MFGSFGGEVGNSRRYFEHKRGMTPGCTSKYGVKMLVWFEEHGLRESAFMRERPSKRWNRRWKLDLVERSNPQWRDPGADFLP